MPKTRELLDGSHKTYFTCAETAVFVRKALKDAFPGVKFSVKSKTYSGGASITVSWTDGPKASDVDAVVGKYAGADFDGMVDLKVYASHWLHPDGSVSIAKREGTNGYLPEIIGDPLGPTATLVHFGADYVFTNRNVSKEWTSEILDRFEEITGKTIPRDDSSAFYATKLPLHIDRDGEILHMVETDTEYLSDLLHRYTALNVRG